MFSFVSTALTEHQRVVGGIFQVPPGRKVLVLRDFLYDEDHTWPGKAVKWKCSSKGSQCPAFILMKDINKVLKDFAVHNHEPTVTREGKKIKFKVRGEKKREN